MEKGKPLVSILVLCYNNQRYIYENLKSIFEQTYPNLEVLIGDDASENFDAEALIGWINKNRTQNIKHITIYENKENLGTVANLEHLQQESQGEYLFQIAADDVLFNRDVIQSFYDKAVELGEEGKFITAQTELWDHELKCKIGDFLKENQIELIKNGSPRDIFAECSWHVFMPACGFYRRSLLDEMGKLSDTYRLVEDYPWSLRMTRMGIRPYFLDIRSSIKHRDGGVSHGNSLHSQETFLTYYRDLLQAYRCEVAPYQSLLTQEEAEKAQRYYQDRTRAYYSIHLPQYMAQRDAQEKAPAQTAEKPQLPKTEVQTVMVRSEEKSAAKKSALRQEVKKAIFTFSSSQAIFCVFVAGLLSLITAFCGRGTEDILCLGLQTVLLWGGHLLLLTCVAQVVLNLWLQIRHFRQRINDL